MNFIIFGIIYIVLFIAFNVYLIIDKKKRTVQLIAEENIINAKVIGNVIARVDDIEENHAVLAYIVNEQMYKKECLNGYTKKIHEVGEIVNIKCDIDNPENVELLETLPKAQSTILEKIILGILIFSIVLMFAFAFI